MCEWWGKSGSSLGIGKSEYSMRSRDVLMCSERYAADMPLRFPNAQLPPISSDFSNTSNGMPCSCRTFAPAIPEEPAPMMATVGSCVMTPPQKMTGASLYRSQELQDRIGARRRRGLEHEVARVLEHDLLRAGDLPREALGARRRGEPVACAPEKERRDAESREAAIVGRQ